MDRDAYKIPFSDEEINFELNPNKKSEKIIANEWYQKGRDDEFNSLQQKSLKVAVK